MYFPKLIDRREIKSNKVRRNLLFFGRKLLIGFVRFIMICYENAEFLYDNRLRGMG